MSNDRQTYAVRLLARNYLVPWPSPVWWRFWEKIPQRKGFQVTLLVDAHDAEEAGRLAHAEIATEMARKATNPADDPYALSIERVWACPEGVDDPGFKHWFSDEEQ